MKITKSWLLDHVTLSCGIDEAAEALSLSGTETTVHDSREWAKKFGVCFVKECKKHPNADSLSVCKVMYRGNEHNIVCGADNVRAGMKSILSLAGISIFPGEKAPLSKSVIRGIESEGMMCTSGELCITDVLGDTDGIIEATHEEGTLLFDILPEDPLLECEITPNRGDLFSVRGIAREIAALGLGALRPLEIYKCESIRKNDRVINNTDACTAFYTSCISDVTNHTDETVVTRRLRSVGLKTISALVDITNYICHDIGRPLHVFDMDAIDGNLTVRLSKQGEIFHGLDDNEYKLPDGIVVISDKKDIVSIAGVLGGKKGSCGIDTKNIMFESAMFDHKKIAFAGRETHILSEARTRFERGIDPALVAHGAHVASKMANEMCAGNVSGITGFAAPIETTHIPFSFDSVSRISGNKNVSRETINARVTATGCSVSGDIVAAPSWRHDLSIEEDIVEEVLRLGCYKEIKPQPFLQPIEPRPSYISWQARRAMVSMGFFESVTFSFMSEKKYLGAPADMTKIRNPLSQDLSVLRESIIPNLIDIASYHKRKNLRFTKTFEIGPVFLCAEQSNILSAIIPITDVSKNVFEIKSCIENVLCGIGATYVFCNIDGGKIYHPGICGGFSANGEVVAKFGKLNPRLRQIFDIDMEFVALEINLSRIALHNVKNEKKHYELPSLNPVHKDLSFLLPKKSPVGEFINVLKNGNARELTDIRVFEIFENEEACGHGNKSASIRCEFQSYGKTFSDEDLHALMDSIVKKASAYGASLRGKW